jgi:integrase
MGDLPGTDSRIANHDRAMLAEHLDYLRMEGRAATTINARRQAVGRLARALPCPILEAAYGDLLGWRSRLAVGPGTICCYVCHVHQFYCWALASGRVPVNPAAGLPVPRLGRRLPRPVAAAELFAALAAAPDRIRLWLVLAAWCGLRAKEIALLRAENILLTAAPPALLVAADATKGRHERLVPLSSFVTGEIEAAGLPRRGWCFLRRDGRPGPNTPTMVSQLASEHFRACGSQATLHMLRHWFGTSAYAVHKDLRVVQELMGHQHIGSTAGYADWSRAAAAETVEALPVPPRLRVVTGGDAC